MNFFSAPNTNSLSDKLVRNVLQRASESRGRSMLSNSPDVPVFFNGNNLPSGMEVSLTTPTADLIRLVKTRSHQSNEMEMSNVTAAAETLIRQRRRVQQRKYRKQQRDYAVNLEYGVHKIHEEIKLLQQQLQYASMGISRSQTLWGAATDYFRLFRQGIRSPTESVYSCALNVLQLSMAPNVSDGPMCGPKSILTRWMIFTLCFDDVHVELQCLENGPVQNTVIATATTSFTISMDSLRLVFPHLIKEGEHDIRVRALADKLLGQRFVVRSTVVFEWDNSIDRITKMQSQSDLLTPMLRVFGNLEEVNCVFEGAKIKPECSLPQLIE